MTDDRRTRMRQVRYGCDVPRSHNQRWLCCNRVGNRRAKSLVAGSEREEEERALLYRLGQ
jgi:hypothetical protein